MNYLAIRQDLHLVFRQRDEKPKALDAVGDVYYLFVLCEDCFNWPERIEPQMVFAYISSVFPEEKEYATIVSRILRNLMAHDPDAVMISLDDGYSVVVYERVSAKAVHKLPKTMTPFIKSIVVQVYLPTDGEEDIV